MIQVQTAGLYLTSETGAVFTNPLFLLATCFAVKPSPATSELPIDGRSAELWISPDPARQFHSLYSYTGNDLNPIHSTDPDGNVMQMVIGAGLNVGFGLTYSLLTGTNYTTTDMMVDAGAGAIGVGVFSNAKRVFTAAKVLNSQLAKRTAARSIDRAYNEASGKILNEVKDIVLGTALGEIVTEPLQNQLFPGGELIREQKHQPDLVIKNESRGVAPSDMTSTASKPPKD